MSEIAYFLGFWALVALILAWRANRAYIATLKQAANHHLQDADKHRELYLEESREHIEDLKGWIYSLERRNGFEEVWSADEERRKALLESKGDGCET